MVFLQLFIMGSPGTQSEKYRCKVYCTTELSENLWKGQEILRIATILIQFTTTVILGHYPCNFQEIS